MTTTTTAIVTLAALALLVLALSLRIVTWYERGVVFRLGRLRPVYDPGLHLVVPFLERLVQIDTRVITLTIPPQEIITEDNMPVCINAVVLFDVAGPVKAVMAVGNYTIAASQIAQTTPGSILDRVGLDTVLAHHSALNADLRNIIEELTEPWGMEVSVVEIKGVEIPEQMQRAMARGAEAKHERCAKIINTRGELQASGELRQAADTLSRSPASLQLRYLQTLLELGADQSSAVVFPLPMDIIEPLLERFGPQGGLPRANEGKDGERTGVPRHR